MNIFLEEHQKLLSLLLEKHVEFILVGGYAVIHYGYRRTTADLDLWLKPDNDNKNKFIEVLKKMEFLHDEIQLVKELNFADHISFSIGEEPAIVDFFTHINMVSWDDAEPQKVIAEIDGLNIPVIHFNHLILSKINNDRTKDRLDVEELQKIRKNDPKKN